MFHIRSNVLGVVVGVILSCCTSLLYSQEWQHDLNGDGFEEQIIASPNGIVDSGVPAGVSTLEVFRGDTGQRIAVFYGDSSNDFGDPLILDDISGDGLPDLIIPRPSHEEVVMIESLWDNEICEEFVHISRGQVITSPDGEVYEFGFEVLPLFDIDGDGINDVQIGAHRLGADEQVYTRVYIFSGLRMLLRAWADSDLPNTTLPRFAGDTNGDAVITDADLDTTILNMGATSATRTMGDFNNNGIVDAPDIVEVLMNLDQMGYLPQTDPNSPCETESAKYRSYIGSAGWSCVTTVPYERFQIVPIVDESGQMNFFVQPWLGDALLQPSEEWHECMLAITDCIYDSEEVQNALELMYSSCGEIAGFELDIECAECSRPNQLGSTRLICKEDGGRSIQLLICSGNPSNVCTALIHEATHVRQACEAGFFTRTMPCSGFRQWYFLPHSTLCREYEAYRADGTPLDQICSRVCNNYFNYFSWNYCAIINCIQCCESSVATGMCCDEQQTWTYDNCLVE